MTIAMGTTVLAQGEALKGETVEMVASRHPRPEEMDAYERVLGDAMAGDSTLFARQDYVEEDWRIVDRSSKLTLLSTSTRKAVGGQPRSTKKSRPPEAGITR